MTRRRVALVALLAVAPAAAQTPERRANTGLYIVELTGAARAIAALP
ncbi:MAG TPA: hypothetical protein VMQ51_03425 [Candidatus Binatia bacterium]|nr:hypothetical protein [Candidatus Binatia bacterium]